MKNKITLVFTMLVLLITCSFLYAGGEQDTASDQPQEIEVWADSFFTPAWEGSQGIALKSIWEEYETQNNVKINLQLVPYPEFQSKLITALIAGNPPDAAIADQYWLASLVETGNAPSIDGLIPKADLNDYFDWAIEGCKIDNKLYALWYQTDCRILFYNKEILAQNGYSSPPETWDELVEISNAVSDNTVAGYGMVITGESGMMNFLIDYWALGGELIDSSGNPAFNKGSNKEISIKIFEFYKDLYNSDIIPKDCITYTSDNDLTPRIIGGGYAMFAGGSWMAGVLQDNLSAEELAKWEVAYRPTANGKKQSIAGGFSLNVFATDEAKRDAAIDFILHIGNTENLGVFCEESKSIPSRESTFSALDAFSNDRFMNFYGTALNYAKTRPNSTLYPVISEKIMNALSEYISGAKSAEEAIEDAESAVLREME